MEIGVRKGENVKIYRNVILRNTEIGNNCILADDAYLDGCQLSNNVRIERRAMLHNTKIGAYSTIGYNSVVRFATIGKFSQSSWNVTIGGAEHPLHHLSTHTISVYGLSNKRLGKGNGDYDLYQLPVSIGNDVWIAAGAQIKRGITIADGAVIGTNAVVTHNVGPYEIWAGVPAKKIGQRFDDRIIERLLKIRWWDLPDNILEENINLFSYDLTNEILEKLESIVIDLRSFNNGENYNE